MTANRAGILPIHAAAIAGCLICCSKLYMAASASPDEDMLLLKDKRGLTAAAYAVQQGNEVGYLAFTYVATCWWQSKHRLEAWRSGRRCLADHACCIMGVASCLFEMSMPISCGSCHVLLAEASTHPKVPLLCALLDFFEWTNGLTSLACRGMFHFAQLHQLLGLLLLDMCQHSWCCLSCMLLCKKLPGCRHWQNI